MKRPEITVEELGSLLHECAGVRASAGQLTGGATFEELGLDSLGVLGVVAEVERRYGVEVPTEAEKCTEPVRFLELLNEAVRAVPGEVA